MSRPTRKKTGNLTHMPISRMNAPPARHDIPMDSREMVKQEFARKLARLLQEREMNQSDLARAADLPRELISTYIRGRSFPTPVSLQRIAKALGYKTTEELLPETMALQSRDEQHPAFDMRVMAGHMDTAWLRINQAVPMDIAAKIMQLIAEARKRTDDTSDR